MSGNIATPYFRRGAVLPSDVPTSFVVFLAAAVVLAVTPGPGVLYVLARTLSGGRQDGIASTFGTSIGGLVHVAVAAVGLSAVLAASAEAFALIKYVGAGYLIFLGVRTILAVRSAEGPDTAAMRSVGVKRAFFEGILTEALNVKTALFFLAFIPQFVSHTLSAAPQFVLYGLICVTLNTAVDLVVVFLAARLMPLLRSPRPARMMSYGSGGVMVGLGTYLALSGNRR